MDERESLAGVEVELGVVCAYRGLCAFGFVHRDVGAAEQLGVVRAVVWGDRRTDARRYPNGDAIEGNGIRERVGELVRDGDERLLVGDDTGARELVAAETGDRTSTCDRVTESFADDPEEFVPVVVSEGVVDFFESVEVDQEDSDALKGFRGLEPRFGVFEEPAPVREAGQYVGAGVAEVRRSLAYLAQRESHPEDHDSECPNRHSGCYRRAGTELRSHEYCQNTKR